MPKAQSLLVHPENPQPRFVEQVARVLLNDGVVAYPTDSGYALGCSAGSPKAIKRLYQIKKPMKKYFMALLFADFSKATQYAVLDNYAFNLIKPRVPGPYTFILPAHHRIARLLDVKRPEIGCRWPTHPFLRALLHKLDTPLLNTAAKLDDAEELTDASQLHAVFGHCVDLIVDCGEIPVNPTNIISLVDGDLRILRGAWH